ncbi:RNA methyltransferase [Oscillospiraceae bacterium MB08-C2-2]|nr:RNA methyltransferase [Oscillospiraceae bacterium MB08-C2-2]
MTSRDNAQVKEIVRLLGQKKQRENTGLFVTEGVKLSLEALESGLHLESVCMTPQAAEKHRELEPLKAAGAHTLFIAKELALRISDTRTPQGVFCIWKQRPHTEADILLKENGRYLILCSLQDPGNMGTVLRTSEAFGVDGVFISSDCPDLYSPKVLRGAMGGIFRLPIALCPDMPALLERLAQKGVALYASALSQEAQSLPQMTFQGSCGLLIGNEGNGLSQELLERCSHQVMIPMAGRAESLNAGVAAGILLWEMCDHR